jgi:hypothetical protein
MINLTKAIGNLKITGMARWIKMEFDPSLLQKPRYAKGPVEVGASIALSIHRPYDRNSQKLDEIPGLGPQPLSRSCHAASGEGTATSGRVYPD